MSQLKDSIMQRLKSSKLLKQSQYTNARQQQLKSSRYYKVNFLASKKTIQSSPIYQNIQQIKQQSSSTRQNQNIHSAYNPLNQRSFSPQRIQQPNKNLKTISLNYRSSPFKQIKFISASPVYQNKSLIGNQIYIRNSSPPADFKYPKYTYQNTQNTNNPTVTLKQCIQNQHENIYLNGMTIPQVTQGFKKDNEAELKKQESESKCKNVLIWILVSLAVIALIVGAFALILNKIHQQRSTVYVYSTNIWKTQKSQQQIQPNAKSNSKLNPTLYLISNIKSDAKSSIKPQKMLQNPIIKDTIKVKQGSIGKINTNKIDTGLFSYQQFYQIDHSNYQFLHKRKSLD